MQRHKYDRYGKQIKTETHFLSEIIDYSKRDKVSYKTNLYQHTKYRLLYILWK